MSDQNETTDHPDEPLPVAEAADFVTIAEAARQLVELRDTWLNPPGASEADLKKRTLTNLYNAPHLA